MVSATPDNANPIIHASTSSRRNKRYDSLDLDDDDHWARLGRDADDREGEESAADEIDGEEIFGECG